MLDKDNIRDLYNRYHGTDFDLMYASSPLADEAEYVLVIVDRIGTREMATIADVGVVYTEEKLDPEEVEVEW